MKRREPKGSGKKAAQLEINEVFEGGRCENLECGRSHYSKSKAEKRGQKIRRSRKGVKIAEEKIWLPGKKAKKSSEGGRERKRATGKTQLLPAEQIGQKPRRHLERNVSCRGTRTRANKTQSEFRSEHETKRLRSNEKYDQNMEQPLRDGTGEPCVEQIAGNRGRVNLSALTRNGGKTRGVTIRRVKGQTGLVQLTTISRRANGPRP